MLISVPVDKGKMLEFVVFSQKPWNMQTSRTTSVTSCLSYKSFVKHNKTVWTSPNLLWVAVVEIIALSLTLPWYQIGAESLSRTMSSIIFFFKYWHALAKKSKLHGGSKGKFEGRNVQLSKWRYLQNSSAEKELENNSGLCRGEKKLHHVEHKECSSCHQDSTT